MIDEEIRSNYSDTDVVPIHNNPKPKLKDLPHRLSLTNNRISPQRQLTVRSRTIDKIDVEHKGQDFQVWWSNLSYIVEPSFISNITRYNRSVRVILKCLSGSFKSRELTAIMGPSGAGKSTLLACVCGKRTVGVSGEVRVIGSKRINVSIITQDDYLTEKMTVNEALIFASKAKNGTHNVPHEQIVDGVVKSLGLEKCLNTRQGRCSGGQRKKISIALELVSKPNILILDEPTSGLDSANCYQTVKLLRQLTQQREPMAVVATIHQPSARVFNLFHSIYVISYNGLCIYHGSPGIAHLLEELNSVHIGCPLFHNPADFIAEIASGEHGDQAITKLTDNQLPITDKVSGIEVYSFGDIQRTYSHSQSEIQHLILLIKRSFILIPREPHLSWLRMVSHIITAIVLGLIFGTEVGSVDGCPPKMETLYNSQKADLFVNFENESKQVRYNLGSIFFSEMFLIFGGLMPMVMVFPNEVNVFIKQYTNGWYSPFTYFVSKIISDFPLITIVTIIYMTTWYLMSGQILELWRYGYVILIGLMMSMLGQSQGIMWSAVFSTNIVRAAYIGTLSIMPFVFVSGFFVRPQTIPAFLRPITYLSYAKYGFETMVISLYGFNRCFHEKANLTGPQPDWLRWFKQYNKHLRDNKDSSAKDYNFANDEAIQKTDEEVLQDILAIVSGHSVQGGYKEHQSIIISHYGYTDDKLYSGLIVLTGFVLTFMILAYYILLWKIRTTTQR